MTGFGYTPPVDPNHKRDYLQEAFVPGTPLKAFQAKTNSVTIFRPIPEMRDGQVVPMVIGKDDYGFRFSNLREESMVTAAGIHTKWGGFVNCSDRPGASEFDLPWSGLFIETRGRQKNNKVPPELITLVNSALQRPAKGGAPLSNVEKPILMQGVLLTGNGQLLNPPGWRTALVLGTSARTSLLELMTQAANAGGDLFDWDRGFTLKIYGRPNGNQPPTFQVELNSPTPTPITAEFRAQCAWTPWESAIKYRTFDEHIRQLHACYGPALLSLRPALAEAAIRLGLPMGPVQVGYTAQPQQPVYPAPQQPVYQAPNQFAPQGAPAQAPNPFAGQPAAVAPNPFGGQPAPAVTAPNPFGGQPAVTAPNPFAPQAAVAPAPNPFAPQGAPAPAVAQNPFAPQAPASNPFGGQPAAVTAAPTGGTTQAPPIAALPALATPADMKASYDALVKPK